MPFVKQLDQVRVSFAFVLGSVLVLLVPDHKHPFFDKVPSLPSVLLVVVHLIHSVLVAVEYHLLDFTY